MSNEVIDKGQWKLFFERLSRQLAGALAEIEVASLSLGDQQQAQWIGLLGITYDPGSDIIDIALDGLNHIVRQPANLAVVWAGATVASLAIETGSGVRHIVKFRQPLSLPPPGASSAAR